MSAAASTLTVEQFLELPEEQIEHCELIGGEIVPMGNARTLHEWAKSRLTHRLVMYLSTHPIGWVYPASMFRVADTEGYIPDLSIVANDADAAMDLNRIPQGAPLLAVEIVSSEAASRLAHKIQHYLAAGARAVWAVYPEERIVDSHHPDRTSRRYLDGDVLEEECLPGFQLAVSEVFPPARA